MQNSNNTLHSVQRKKNHSNVSYYYTFDMPMPNRSGQNDQLYNDKYRFGFQGQEEDTYSSVELDPATGQPLVDPNTGDPIVTERTLVNYKYRMHDPRIGRFFSIDPLASKYPHNSPYAFSENRVIDGVELEGLEYSPSGAFKYAFSSAFGWDIDSDNSNRNKEALKNTAKNISQAGTKIVKETAQAVQESPMLGALVVLSVAPIIAEAASTSVSLPTLAKFTTVSQGIDVAIEATEQGIINGFDVNKMDLIDIPAAILPWYLEEPIKASSDYTIKGGFKSIVNEKKSYKSAVGEMLISLSFKGASAKMFNGVEKNTVNNIVKRKTEAIGDLSGKALTEGLKKTQKESE